MSEKYNFYFILIRNFIIAGAYLFLLFGSIYGLLLDQVSIPYRFAPMQYLVFQAGPKIMLCLTGLLLAAAVTALPLVAMILRAITQQSSTPMAREQMASRVYRLVLGFFCLLLLASIGWQLLNTML